MATELHKEVKKGHSHAILNSDVPGSGWPVLPALIALPASTGTSRY